ncbi:MAG TPA: efflux RND transporter periplasmic adaptor subunit [Phototrophicaceae bacterium]|nr:efflux RND transporter periplasmic adaptor subunit [Phototrophicaceae bacterium]
MNQQLLMTIAGAAIIALGGAMMIWWLTGRLKSGGLRKVTRIVGLPILLIAVALGGFLMARSQLQLLPQATPLTVVSETKTVALGTLTQTLSSTGSLDAADEKTLTFATSAPVTAVNVQVGDTVTKGEVLASVDTSDIDSTIASAQLTLASANQALAALEAPASDLDVASAKLSVEAAQASLSSASQTGSSDTDKQIAEYQEELAKNSLWQAQLQRDMSAANANPNAANAYANSVTTAASLANQETNVEIQTDETNSVLNDTADASQLSSANAQLTSAQANLNELLAGASDSDLAQAKITVQQAQLALDTAEAAKSDAEIVAPFDGVVAAVDFTVGAMPGSGSITLLDTSHYTITLSVDEKDITQLAVGQSVDLTIAALDNASLTGTVTTIDPVPTTSNNLVTYDVEVTLDNTSAAVRPGMSAVADIILDSESNVIVIPSRFITTDAATGQSTVKVETAPGVYTDTAVTLGATTDSESVITSGLSVGQTIVIETTASSGSSSTSQQNGLGLLGGLSGGAGGPPSGGAGGPPSGGNFGGNGGGGSRGS